MEDTELEGRSIQCPQAQHRFTRAAAIIKNPGHKTNQSDSCNTTIDVKITSTLKINLKRIREEDPTWFDEFFKHNKRQNTAQT
jgi:hypothetical protein